MSTSNTNQQTKNAVSTIMLTGFITGSLDITAACIQYYSRTGKGPGNVLRFVASGFFGTKAFAGGAAMAVWGLLFHFLIAFSFTVFFFWLYPKIPVLAKNKLITGLVYGIFVWAVMNLIIVPLSNIPASSKLWATITNTVGKRLTVLQFPSDPTQMIIGLIIIMFCIGLPVSLLTGRYYPSKTNR